MAVAAACAPKQPLPENAEAAEKEIRRLYKEEKADSALLLVDRLLTETDSLKIGDEVNYLKWKKHFHTADSNFKAALPIAIEIEKKSERKSPWRCIEVAEIYLELNKIAEANDWFVKAVDLGFKSLGYLKEEPFSKLTGLEGFDALEQKMKDNIGIDQPAKDFTVKLLDGTDFVLSQMKGKVVVIDFWATWCPPCRKEIPNLVKLYNEKHKDGLEIMGISLDRPDDLENLKKFLPENGMEWKISYSGEYWSDPTAKFYGVNSIPSVWLVDKKGVLRYFDMHGEELVEKVNELLAE